MAAMANESPISEGGTGAPTKGEGGLSVPIGVHYDALLAQEEKFQQERLAADEKFHQERDRRYAELRADDQKALGKALDATQLAIDKAEKRNQELLEGFPQEYATKGEVQRLMEDFVKLARDAVPEALYTERHRILEEKIVEIQNILSGEAGGKTQAERDIVQQQWRIGIGITIVVVIINLIFYLVTIH